MSVGENIAKLRNEIGLSQRELAEGVGISQSMVAQIERGSKALTVPLAKQIAEKLGKSITDIIGN